ncbi:hypothetical protein OEA41_004663 [Lepraria neglecta]|uniref:Glutathione S-transferase n=1 Tax=Lepraria neglecta TaxID=209136 RepID=A0AAD9Z1G0_9LECA|nr:hypothetical protein OEA41_004663 [Lepraria neglecta]
MVLQPITLYSAPFGPNPWKVAIILTELSIPFETVAIWDATELKKAPYATEVNANGREPGKKNLRPHLQQLWKISYAKATPSAIKDPNTGIILWESCAIISYLIAEYDKSHTISYATTPEKYLQDQWFFFQASGQGPYYGQAGWFNLFHPEKLPSAQKRYNDEMKRVVGVLGNALAKSKSGWLVGDKCTYVDLAFFMWDENIEQIMAPFEGEWDPAQFPNWQKWHGRMAEREAVKKVVEEQAKMLAGAKH